MEDDFTIIYVSDIPWQDLTQRQHHLCNNLAVRNSVIFFSCNSITQLRKYFKKRVEAKGNLEVKELFILPLTRILTLKRINFWIAKLFLKIVLRDKKVVLILSHPSQVSLASLPIYKLFYDYVDDACNFKGVAKYSSLLRSYEDSIINKASGVFAPSYKILNYLKSRFKTKSIFVPNGVNTEDFLLRDNLIEPSDISNLKTPLVGFYGAVNELFDLNLLIFTARELPDFTFIIIGPISINIEAVKEKNIIFLGAKPYIELVNYLAKIKLWIIPFVQTEFSEILNPVKVYEYLSAGRYVVSTFLPELLFMTNFISLTSNYNDFTQAIKINIDKDNVSNLPQINLMLESYKWSNIAKDILNEVKSS